MDKLSVAHQRGLKQAKAKKKPIKIVHISNPMKVTTTTSEFKGLVQELTGQDSDMALLSKFAEADGAEDPAESAAPPAAAYGGPRSTDDYISDDCSADFGNAEARPLHQQQWGEGYRGSENQLDVFDEIFASQMLVDFACFMPSFSYQESSPSADDSGRFDGAGRE